MVPPLILKGEFEMTGLNIQQQAVLESVRAGNNVVVKAPPGTGKTFTLRNVAVDQLSKGKSVAAFAFTNKMKDELDRLMPEGVFVNNFHKLGLSFIYKEWGKVSIKKNLVRDLFKKLYGPEYNDNKSLLVYVEKILTLAKADQRISKEGKKKVFLTEEDFEGVIEDHELKIPGRKPQIFQAINWILEEQRKLWWKSQSTINLDDMVFLPVFYDMSPSKVYDLVMIDECQDFTITQGLLNIKVGRQVLAVGDENQAIFYFAGASSDSMTRIKNEINAVELELTMTYRFGKTIAEYVNNKYGTNLIGMSPHDGEVVYLSRNEALILADDETLFLSRTNAPLVKYALWLLANGIQAYIVGKDFGGSLISTIYSLAMDRKCSKCGSDLHRKQNQWGNYSYACSAWPECSGEFVKPRIAEASINQDLSRFLQELATFDMQQKEKLEGDELETHTDLISVLSELAYASNSVDDMVLKIESMFTEDAAENACNLSTIHKAKGLESDTVIIIPTESKPPETEREETEENNVAFVRDTRAKKSLCYITD